MPAGAKAISAGTETDPPVFLKQYGAQRTGTNLLRALLTENFHDVIVLMHVLGNKHAPPVAFDELWERAAGAADPAWEFVRSATWEAPAATTRSGRPEQLAYMLELAGPLTTAVCSRRLGFLISVRDPYAWAISILRWLGWLPEWISRTDQQQAICAWLRGACGAFNHGYAAWLALYDRFPERTSIVRHEDVAQDPVGTLTSLARRHELKRRNGEFAFVSGTVLPTSWDNLSTQVNGAAFRYADRHNLPLLTPPMRDTVTASIDWVLMHKFGYDAMQ